MEYVPQVLGCEMDTIMDTQEIISRWQQNIHDCAYSLEGIERAFGLRATQLRAWLFKGVIPNKKSREKVEGIMMHIKQTKRIPYHPSFGYATPAQIERLKQNIQPDERARIMKQVKLQGKID